MTKSFLPAIGCLAFALPALADWSEFRGPNRDGTVDAALPTQWSEEKNVAWKKELHGLGLSTPLVMEGKIWLTTATESGREMSVLCFDEQTGEVLLDRVFITNDNPEPLDNTMNTYASSTGVVEPGRVWFHFGSYGTFCLDTETFEILWQRRDFTLSHWRGAGSSIARWENTLVLTFDGADQQYLVALDKETGETLWRRDRSTDYDDETDGVPANSGDMRKAYSTPIFVEVGDTVQMISNGAKACWAYDVETGEEIWSVHYPTHSPSSRPVYSEETGFVYINTGLGKAEIWAVRLDPEAKGEIADTHVEWTFFQRTPKRSSPVLANGLLFMANDGVVSCLDAETGEVQWAERAGGEYSASLLAANDLVYFCDEEGLCTVVKAAPEFEIVAENHFDEGFMASPAAGDAALFLRTKTHLYRVEE
ncbi:MAG: PQQ-binding-like beta-propeller repeat protein [Verrucomicrobiales bacterium]